MVRRVVGADSRCGGVAAPARPISRVLAGGATAAAAGMAAHRLGRFRRCGRLGRRDSRCGRFFQRGGRRHGRFGRRGGRRRRCGSSSRCCGGGFRHGQALATRVGSGEAGGGPADTAQGGSTLCRRRTVCAASSLGCGLVGFRGLSRRGLAGVGRLRYHGLGGRRLGVAGRPVDGGLGLLAGLIDGRLNFVGELAVRRMGAGSGLGDRGLDAPKRLSLCLGLSDHGLVSPDGLSHYRFVNPSGLAESPAAKQSQRTCRRQTASQGQWACRPQAVSQGRQTHRPRTAKQRQRTCRPRTARQCRWVCRP